MYSQNDEEARILKHFQTHLPTGPRRFLDIGAHDGQTFSNTLALVEQGWAGVCVEPSPSVFPRLMKLHQKRPEVILVQAALSPGPDPQLTLFWDCHGDGLSTIEPKHLIKWHQIEYQMFYVYTLPILDFLDAFKTDFAFVNLDVESLNLELFEAIPWERFQNLSLICVEHDNHAARILTTAQKHGFHLVSQNPENLLLAKG